MVPTESNKKTVSGKLVVVSGPSGAGKTTVLRRLLERSPVPLFGSVSATTRQPRPGERDGIDYHFLSEDEFERRRRAGEFLECFQVFGHGWYGTLGSEVQPLLDAGRWVLLEIDVQGATAVLEKHPDAVTIFLSPGSIKILEERLRGRGTNSEASIRRRLARATEEMAMADRYSHVVVNDEVERAVEEICKILGVAVSLRET